MDALLKILRHRALAPREEIALELGLSVEELNNRIASLESSGVVLGYQAVIDTEKLDEDDVTALIEVSIRPERGGGFDRLARRIAKFDQVQGCYLMSGGYDLLVVVSGANLREISHFVAEKLSTVEGVLSTATRFRLKTYKENGVTIARDEEPSRLAVSP
ncbi:MAG: Lrp/AsnC family transcriptional regulator [Verrucomicrobiia bacterium]